MPNAQFITLFCPCRYVGQSTRAVTRVPGHITNTRQSRKPRLPLSGKEKQRPTQLTSGVRWQQPPTY